MCTTAKVKIYDSIFLMPILWSLGLGLTGAGQFIYGAIRTTVLESRTGAYSRTYQKEISISRLVYKDVIGLGLGWA